MTATTRDHVVPPPHRSGLARVVRVAAPLWAFGAGLTALAWAITGRGYPFEARPGGDPTLLRWVPEQVGAPLLAALLLALAAGLTWAARTPGPGRRGRALILGLGWGSAAVLALGLAGLFPLAVTGYGPMLPIMLLTGFGGMTWHSVLPYAGTSQVIAVYGGMLVAVAVLSWQWRTAGRCDRCGLGPGEQPDRDRWARIGRWSVAVAVAVPLLYAITRLAWVLDVPLGISREMLDDVRSSPGVWVPFGLGTFALVGSVLTLGLVQRWGEVFPAWTLWLRGRRVPIALAVVPAGVVSVLSLGAGLSALSSRQFLGGVGAGAGPGAVAPALAWPLWGLALLVATVAYARRRQEQCRHRDA